MKERNWHNWLWLVIGAAAVACMAAWVLGDRLAS